jgi:hypothetical protein
VPLRACAQWAGCADPATQDALDARELEQRQWMDAAWRACGRAHPRWYWRPGDVEEP